MEQYIIFAALLILGYSVVYLVLKKKIEKSLDPAALLDQIREEISRTIVEMNQTTDRNIALIEDRIGNLVKLLGKADKRISLFRREAEKHAVSKKVYQAVLESKPPQEVLPATTNSSNHESKHAFKQSEVLNLHNAGFSGSLIAKKLNLPMGEIELIISLSKRIR
ncbi:MAG TPA: hypothetical protein ENI27_06070 [bacterium]|nr:hypothetical protein [bacterium]